MTNDEITHFNVLSETKKSIEELGNGIVNLAKSNHLFSILCNICDYSVKQAERIEEFYKTDIDILAFSVRNLFEVSLLLNYYLYKSNDNDLKLFEEIKRDALEIEQGFELLDKLSNGNVTDINLSNELQFKKTPNVMNLSKILGAEEEYNMFYKLYSKYAHPSAYFLFVTKKETEAPEVKFMFLLQGTKYLKEIESNFKSIYNVVIKNA